MKLDYFNKNFLETNIRYLQVMLIWPPDYEKYCWKRNLYSIGFWTGFVLTACAIVTSETIYLLIHFNDYVETIRTMSVLMFHIIYIYKLFSWLHDKDIANLCIEFLHRESYNFEYFENIIVNCEEIEKKKYFFVDERFSDNNISTDTSNLEKFWVKNAKYSRNVEQNKNLNRKTVKNIQDEITTETNIHNCLLIITMQISIVVAIAFMYCDCLHEVIQELFFGEKDGLRPFPINIYVPLDLNNIKIYSAVSIYTIFITIYTAMQYVGIDFFFWSMLIHMEGQIRVIKYALHCIDITPDVTYICKMNLQFSKCMHEMQQLIRLLDALKSIYSKPLLLQYLFVMIVSCCVLYTITQEHSILTAIGLVGYVVCALTNSFFNIFYITQLRHQFAEVPNALYMINWVGTNAKFQKQIVFAMARMQKTIGIKMGNMIEVNLNVFVKILQTTYSFFTLLQRSNR